MNDCLSIPVSVLKIQVLPFTCTSFIVILILYKRFESSGDDKSKYLPSFFYQALTSQRVAWEDTLSNKVIDF